jgi:hypothetical protein
VTDSETKALRWTKRSGSLAACVTGQEAIHRGSSPAAHSGAKLPVFRPEELMGKGLGEEIRLVTVSAQLPAQMTKFDELMVI